MSGSEGAAGEAKEMNPPIPAEQAADVSVGPAPAEAKREPGPRIYAASLSDYNAGILHGWWIWADNTVDVIEETIQEMLAESPTAARYGDAAEEWAIHDYEGFGPVRLGEYEPVERVAALARGIHSHGAAFAAWWTTEEPTSTDQAELGAAFEEQYLGDYDSADDYGWQLLADLGFDPNELPGIPDGIRPYVRVDVAGWVRDMQYGGELRTEPSETGIYVFSTL